MTPAQAPACAPSQSGVAPPKAGYPSPLFSVKLGNCEGIEFGPQKGTPPPLNIFVFHKKLADYFEQFHTDSPCSKPPRSGLGTVNRSLSARIPQSRRDAADRRGNGAIHLRRIFAGRLRRSMST